VRKKDFKKGVSFFFLGFKKDHTQKIKRKEKKEKGELFQNKSWR
jgi:hypothetical protein